MLRRFLEPDPVRTLAEGMFATRARLDLVRADLEREVERVRRLCGSEPVSSRLAGSDILEVEGYLAAVDGVIRAITDGRWPP